MKARGHLPAQVEDRDDESGLERLPRVVVGAPRDGHVHAASKAELEHVLSRLGPAFVYGLRSIELVRGDSRALEFGRFVAVGKILIFDVPAPPWRLRLRPDAADRLTRSGAVVSSGPATDMIEWPRDSLRDFVLFDVLLHELGHHVLQHHRGKRPVRIARTSAHEAYADLVASRARHLLGVPR
jgi:hypothetical protein